MDVTRIRITARPAEGWRRAGIRHPAQLVEYPADRFTGTQMAALRGDPNLIVELINGGEIAPNLIIPSESNHGEGGQSGPPSDGQSGTGTEPAAISAAETEGAAGDGAAVGTEDGKRRDTASRPKNPKAAARTPVQRAGEQTESKA